MAYVHPGLGKNPRLLLSPEIYRAMLCWLRIYLHFGAAATKLNLNKGGKVK